MDKDEKIHRDANFFSRMLTYVTIVIWVLFFLFSLVKALLTQTNVEAPAWLEDVEPEGNQALKH